MSDHHAERQIHALGVFVHGALTALHLLGIVFNAKRRQWADVAIHSGGVIYSAGAVNRHYWKSQVSDEETV